MHYSDAHYTARLKQPQSFGRLQTVIVAVPDKYIAPGQRLGDDLGPLTRMRERHCWNPAIESVRRRDALYNDPRDIVQACDQLGCKRFFVLEQMLESRDNLLAPGAGSGTCQGRADFSKIINGGARTDQSLMTLCAGLKAPRKLFGCRPDLVWIKPLEYLPSSP